MHAFGGEHSHSHSHGVVSYFSVFFQSEYGVELIILTSISFTFSSVTRTRSYVFDVVALLP